MTHPLTDRIALAACPMAVLRPCPSPCQDCRQFAERVAVELVRVVREIHAVPEGAEPEPLM